MEQKAMEWSGVLPHEKKQTPKMVKNSAGGQSFAVDDKTRLVRFLILGCEGGTFYASQKKLGLENAKAILRMLQNGQGKAVVEEAVDVSIRGRAAKQTPTLFVLAMAARLGDVPTRKLVYEALPKCLRTPTMLFEFITLMENMGSNGTGWGRGMRRAVAEIYNQRKAKDLAFWVTKYRNREGWNHRDVLRLAHVKPISPAHQLVLAYSVKDVIPAIKEDVSSDKSLSDSLEFLTGVEEARRMSEDNEGVNKLLGLIAKHRLAREHIPSGHLNSVPVWKALLNSMPITAMMRNLAKMTSIEVLKPLSAETGIVCSMLRSPDILKKARVHPFSVLLALKTYESGRGVKGSLSWNPVPEIVAALDDAFNLSFNHVEPTGKRFLLGLDVSGSMSCGSVNGSPCITPRVATAAMAMVTMRTEKKTHPMAFTSNIVPLKIHSKMSLNDVIRETSNLPFGGTDCAQPMLYALKNKLEVDVFVVYTDCETWAGQVTPFQALKQYRKATGIPARLVVVAMTSNGFTLADPSDKGMLDMVGFDSSAPQILREFAMGAL